MSTIIKIRRSSTTTAPLELAQGELAYSYGTGSQANNGDRIFIGTGTEINGVAASIDVIGGKYFTDMLDHAHGTLTNSSALIVDSNGKIDIFNVDNLTLNGNDITSTDVNGNINITPNGTGRTNVKNLTATTQIVSDLEANRVVLTGTSGQLIEYNSFNWNTGSDSSINVQIVGNLDVNGDADIDNVNINGNTITTTDTNGNLVLTADGSGIVNFNGTKAIKLPVGTDADKSGFTAVQGAIRYNTTAQQFEGYNGSNWSGLGGVIDVNQDTKILAELTSGSNNDKLYFYTNSVLRMVVDQNGLEMVDQSGYIDVGNIRLAGNRISTTDGNAANPSTLYIDPNPSGTPGTVVIEGNLQVNGTQTVVNSTVTSVNDPIFTLGDTVSTKTVEVGVVASTTLATQGAQGDTTVEVASATGIANGDVVTGAGIDNNTTVTNVTGTTITLSNPVATTMASGAAILFTDIVLASGASSLDLADVDNITIGDAVSGTGIAGGTTVSSVSVNTDGTGTIGLSANTNANISDNASITITQATDDNRDRGIKFHYFSGTAKSGFFGFDDSTGELTFIPDATDTASVITGDRGVAHFGDLKLDGNITTYGEGAASAITDGELLIGNSATGAFDKIVLARTADTPITITNGNGTITFDIETATTIGTTDTDRGLQTDTDYNVLDLTASGNASQNKAAQGVASFASEQFNVNAGHVYIATIDGGTY